VSNHKCDQFFYQKSFRQGWLGWCVQLMMCVSLCLRMSKTITIEKIHNLQEICDDARSQIVENKSLFRHVKRYSNFTKLPLNVLGL